MTLNELRQQLEAKRLKLHTVFQQAGDTLDLDKVTELDGDTAAKAAAIKSMNDEMSDLGKQIEEKQHLEKTRDQVNRLGEVDHSQLRLPAKDNGGPERAERERKAFSQMVVESAAWTGYKGGGVGPVATIDHEVKALMDTATGWTVQNVRGPRLVESAQEMPRVADLIPQTTTNQQAIVYMEETTFTNAAVEVAEGGPKPEATLALTEKTSPVQKIAVWLPVTDELFEDHARAQSYVENRLRFMLLQRLDGQIMGGNGTPPNLRGLHNVVGINVQAKGADPTPDAVYKAMTKIRVLGQAIPSGVVFHPNDWQEIRLLRTADGIYIWGSPSEAGPERLWGLPVVQSAYETENRALVGDFANFSELAFRSGITVQVTNSHASYFISNILVVLLEFRVALICYRPKAFAEVTGI